MDSLLEPLTENEKQHFCVEMMKRLDIQRRNEHFCDVTLEVGSGDDQARLKAHRIVLCAASPFFYNALNSDMKEKKEGVIRLEETSKSVMEEVLEFLYTGHVNITKENAFDLFAQADFFLLPNLKRLSGDFILQTLSVGNCVMVYYFAAKYQWEELQKGAKDFILANFVTVAETEDFLNLSSKQVEEWISSDGIVVEGEENVFEVVVKWIEKRDADFQCFFDLFQHVRFIYVPRNYLSKMILPHRFVKDRKTCVNLVLDAMNCISDGTEECFFSLSPRNCLKTHEDAVVVCGRKKTLCYIPSQSKVYQLTSLPTMHMHNPFHYNMSVCHGKLYILGGFSWEGSFMEYYDPSLNVWFPMHPPDSVYPYSALVTFQGFLYTIGGVDKKGERVSTVQKYNPDSNLWQAVPPLSAARSDVCAVADESFLYVIGGIDTTGQSVNTVERFDPTTNTWGKLPSTLARRSGASGAVSEHKLFVFGGLQLESMYVDYPCEVYDPVTSVWSGISSSFAPRIFASAVSYKGEIFVSGYFRNEEGEEKNSLQLGCDVYQDEWICCVNFSKFHKIFPLRIPRNVLAQCKPAQVS